MTRDWYRIPIAVNGRYEPWRYCEPQAALSRARSLPTACADGLRWWKQPKPMALITRSYGSSNTAALGRNTWLTRRIRGSETISTPSVSYCNTNRKPWQAPMWRRGTTSSEKEETRVKKHGRGGSMAYPVLFPRDLILLKSSGRVWKAHLSNVASYISNAWHHC